MYAVYVRGPADKKYHIFAVLASFEDAEQYEERFLAIQPEFASYIQHWS